MATASVNDSAETLAKAAMVAGEVLLPGASELMAGHVLSGVAHFVGTGLAVAMLAPTMPLLAVVAAIGIRVNSYQHASQGKTLWSDVTRSSVITPP